MVKLRVQNSDGTTRTLFLCSPVRLTEGIDGEFSVITSADGYNHYFTESGFFHETKAFPEVKEHCLASG